MKTLEDFAHQMRWLADDAYPEVEKVRVVLDNLNTHRPASLYEAFEPKEARRVIQRLEFHYTPKHGSWLNMAEIEFSVFSNQRLNRRIEDEVSLKREIAALETERNQAGAIIEWRSTTTDARHKLRRIYPSVLDRRSTSYRAAKPRLGISLRTGMIAAFSLDGNRPTARFLYKNVRPTTLHEHVTSLLASCPPA